MYGAVEHSPPGPAGPLGKWKCGAVGVVKPRRVLGRQQFCGAGGGGMGVADHPVNHPGAGRGAPVGTTKGGSCFGL